jgi:hypothetical protein
MVNERTKTGAENDGSARHFALNTLANILRRLFDFL